MYVTCSLPGKQTCFGVLADAHMTCMEYTSMLAGHTLMEINLAIQQHEFWIHYVNGFGLVVSDNTLRAIFVLVVPCDGRWTWSKFLTLICFDLL